jgi:hypothetical protein
MSASEQVWFAVGISGTVIFLEGVITFIGGKLFKKRDPNELKVYAGFFIFLLALIMLFNVN